MPGSPDPGYHPSVRLCATVLVLLSLVGCRERFRPGHDEESEGSDSTGDGSEGTSDGTGSTDDGDTAGGPCDAPADFDHAFLGPSGERCFFVKAGNFTWLSARGACIAEDAELATIDSSPLQDLLFIELSAANVPDLFEVWIGAHRTAPDTEFEWVSGEPWDFTSWGPDQPNEASDEACVQAHEGTGWVWHDEPCDVIQTGTLCER